MLGGWIYAAAGAGVISAIATSIAPKGRTRSAVKLACGLLVTTVLLAPAADFDYTTLSQNAARYREEGETAGRDMTREKERITALIIERECAAYIVDKSVALGVTGLEAAVSVEWSRDGAWYPTEARLSANPVPDDARRSRLNGYIESELGISPERIIWSGKDPLERKG
jgi:hypothetical protein